MQRNKSALKRSKSHYWFQIVSRWFQIVSDGFSWFQVVPRFSIYEKKDAVEIFILQETKNSSLFDTEKSNLIDKNCTQENVNAIFKMMKVDLDES